MVNIMVASGVTWQALHHHVSVSVSHKTGSSLHGAWRRRLRPPRWWHLRQWHSVTNNGGGRHSIGGGDVAESSNGVVVGCMKPSEQD